jgi:hypothetical protein
MVCAAVNHGGNRKHKIVERKQWQEEESSNEKGSEQENKKFRKGGENEGPCGVRAAQGRQIQDTSLTPEARSRASPPGNPSSGARRSNRSPRPARGETSSGGDAQPGITLREVPGQPVGPPTGAERTRA